MSSVAKQKWKLYVGKGTHGSPDRPRKIYCKAEGPLYTQCRNAANRRACTPLTNRRAHQVRWPLPCARRDGKQRVNVGSYCARRGQQGDVQERIQHQNKRLLRRGESSATKKLAMIHTSATLPPPKQAIGGMLDGVSDIAGNIADADPDP